MLLNNPKDYFLCALNEAVYLCLVRNIQLGLLNLKPSFKPSRAKSNSVPLNKDYLTSVLSDCLVGNILFSWNFAFNSPSFINSKPSSAEDFFDVDKYKTAAMVFKEIKPSDKDYSIKADLTIKAIGYQWYWGYEYPDENIIFESYMFCLLYTSPSPRDS